MSKPKPKKKEKEYEVEQIRAARANLSTGQHHFLIKWKDFDESHTCWEPESYVHAADRVDDCYRHMGHLGKNSDAKWKWEYYMDEAKDGKAIGWHSYDQHASDSMSKFFWLYCSDTSKMSGVVECVLSGKYHYEIDFDAMKQKNVGHPDKKVRPIRGLPV